MLLAAAGQAAPYTHNLHGSSGGAGSVGVSTSNAGSARKLNVNGNASATVASSTHNSTSSTSTTVSTQRPTTTIASNAASALMKTLSVRLHRGTEFIKETVQKALVVSAATPAAQQPIKVSSTAVSQQQSQKAGESHSLKRKLSGAGGLMGCGSGFGSSSSTSRNSIAAPYIAPTSSFLKNYTVAPTALHRSATARKRIPSTDSLLMDLCLFKPIRPAPITPIKINKARGFELKKPKFVPAHNTDSEYDDDDDDDDEDDEDDDAEQIAAAVKEEVHKPKPSTLKLPHANSAFVPMLYVKQALAKTTNDNDNTNTSGIAITKPKAATKRRRRAPLLTVKRRRKPQPPTAAAVTKPAATAARKRQAVDAKPTTSKPAVPAKRSRGSNANVKAAAAVAHSSISPMRPSPPLTRQRARQQISATQKF